MSFCVAAVANGLKRLWCPPVSQVRYRFHKDKIDAGPLVRRYGYEEKILNRGPLPHVKHDKHLPGPQYIPQSNWSKDKALFGQNDYIDIFSGNLIHPTKIHYEVPFHLRGFKGNEYQCLLRSQRMMKHGKLPYQFPSEWNKMNKRIKYLYKYLNRYTRTWFSYNSRHCS